LVFRLQHYTAFPALLVDAMMNDPMGEVYHPAVARRAAQRIIVGAGRLQEWKGVYPSEKAKLFVDYNVATGGG